MRSSVIAAIVLAAASPALALPMDHFDILARALQSGNKLLRPSPVWEDAPLETSHLKRTTARSLPWFDKHQTIGLVKTVPKPVRRSVKFSLLRRSGLDDIVFPARSTLDQLD
ncbi:hypothetical protein POSPLADRAFT_1074758 [Postia placenta MAD-698-R-SB12]|uniref:Uncharacterized protein n=1 Tax=Postia placenta MAD-698-R-SB12 TaxID=670580 RepID=A0A1X6MX49_9APHY|nr:hypothetical protein POSPLADRAFT_1074758 [Postia placenta MAD-698-R-SB12]OSX60931.1 hypothetical protein POSPLADRAFT_1074758 [Postia placenta MAD-698-R-SB12]